MKSRFIATLFIAILLLGCNRPTEHFEPISIANDLPIMNVIVGGEVFETARGGYCWTVDIRAGSKMTKCTDSSGDPFHYVDKAPPIKVKKGNRIELRFTEKPDSMIIYLDTRGSKMEPIDENIFDAPTTEGMYGYSVFTKFAQGDVTFHFVLEVQ